MFWGMGVPLLDIIVFFLFKTPTFGHWEKLKPSREDGMGCMDSYCFNERDCFSWKYFVNILLLFSFSYSWLLMFIDGFYGWFSKYVFHVHVLWFLCYLSIWFYGCYFVAKNMFFNTNCSSNCSWKQTWSPFNSWTNSPPFR